MQNLIDFVIQAEKAGFTSTMTSDHFHPWWHNNGYGNFTWIWLATALERTKKMSFTTGVTSPIFRYNPAIIAQAFASLDVLYPRRINLGLGSGEAMNEVSVGFTWTSAKIRLKRTIEAIQIIKKLWNKDKDKEIKDSITKDYNDESFVNFNGEFFKIKDAKLYTPPSSGNIPIYLATSGLQSAKSAARYTDGLITNLKPEKASKVFDAFDNMAKQEGKDVTKLQKIGKPMVSYSKDYDSAVKSIGFWRATEIDKAFDLEINDPRKLQDKAEKEVSDSKLIEASLIVTSIEDLIKPIEEYYKTGFTQVFVHSSSPNETEFIKEFCKKVLPHFTANNNK